MLAVASLSKLNDLCFGNWEEYRGEMRQTKEISELDSEISNVLSSIGQLLVKYKMYNRSKDSPVVSGGLQQFIINKLKKKGEPERSLTQRLKALYLKDETVQFQSVASSGEEVSMFDCMPVDIKLRIFSYLDARSLCLACGVSQGWSQLLWDDLLWRQRLAVDMVTWPQVSHLTNPHVYTQAASDLSYKEIYLRCCPEVLARQREENSAFHQVSSVLKYLMPRKVPKAAMFGPGLESSTSGIVRKMLYDDSSIFTRVAMFPGQFEGMGGGMTLQLPQTSQTFHLTVLYSASRREREGQSQQGRMARNRMVNHQPQREGINSGRGAGGNTTYELQPAMQQLCHTLNAFIFVIDATDSREAVASSREELVTMVQERWAAPHVPVLVLSCVPEPNTPRLPAVDLAHILRLSDFNRPWMVMDCVVETMDNVNKGMLWMIEMCQRK